MEVWSKPLPWWKTIHAKRENSLLLQFIKYWQTQINYSKQKYADFSDLYTWFYVKIICKMIHIW